MAELQELVSVRRPEIAERLQRARDFTHDVPGEFNQDKTDQAFVEGRILQLEALLASARYMADGQTADYVHSDPVSRWSPQTTSRGHIASSAPSRRTRAMGWSLTSRPLVEQCWAITSMTK